MSFMRTNDHDYSAYILDVLLKNAVRAFLVVGDLDIMRVSADRVQKIYQAFHTMNSCPWDSSQSRIPSYEIVGKFVRHS